MATVAPNGIIILMGLPAAGKSTMALKLGKLLPQLIILNEDEIIEDEGIQPGDFKNASKKMFLKVQNVFEKKPKGLVLIDATMHLDSMRKPFWTLAIELQIKIIFIHLKVSLPEAIRRNNGRSKAVCLKSLLKINESFEDLTLSQSHHLITFCENESNEESQLSTILSQMIPPLKKESIVLQNHISSKLHDINLAINSSIHEILTQTRDYSSFNQLRNLKTKILTEARKDPSLTTEDCLKLFHQSIKG